LGCWKNTGPPCSIYFSLNIKLLTTSLWWGSWKIIISLEKGSLNLCVSSFFNDRLCGLVVRVSGYRSRVPGFDSQPYHIFWVIGGLQRDPFSLVRTIEELLEWESSGSGIENRV
jgi:hypothetical protein